MLHQLPHQLLTLKNKIINFKNYKKQKNIIKKKWWNLDLWGLTQNVHNKHKPRFKYNITNPDLSTSFSASLSFFLQSSFFLPLFLLSPSILVLSLLEVFKQVPPLLSSSTKSILVLRPRCSHRPTPWHSTQRPHLRLCRQGEGVERLSCLRSLSLPTR